MAMSVVAKAVVRAARAIMKIKGIAGIVGESPEGVKKAYRIISSTGKTKAIQNLIAQSPSKVTIENLRQLLKPEKTLSKAVSYKGGK